MENSEKFVPTWKIIVAFLLDLMTSFMVFGYIVGWLTGGLSAGGFQLNGLPALAVFALVVGYFVVFGKYGRGTIWQRILGARRRRQDASDRP